MNSKSVKVEAPQVENLYGHPDGGYYCLLSDDAPMKHPATGEWIDGVIYVGTDGRMRSTSRERWDDRFIQVKNIVLYPNKEDHAAILSMIRRCNPGDRDLDFVRVFESWHESEVNLTAQMLDLVVASVFEKMVLHSEDMKYSAEWSKGVMLSANAALTITTEDLQRVSRSYEIEREAKPHGFTFTIRK